MKFLTKVDFRKNKEAYFYAVSTQGASAGNSFVNVDRLLRRQWLELNAAFEVKMFANYVALYNMAKNPENANEEATVVVEAIAKEVKEKVEKPFSKKESIIAKLMSDFMAPKFAMKDKGFNVSSECGGCGICKKVCPVNNIEIVAHKPTFKHKCEQCMACIQNCPSKALNYKNKTQKRGRYINPEITVQDLFVEGK